MRLEPWHVLHGKENSSHVPETPVPDFYPSLLEFRNCLGLSEGTRRFLACKKFAEGVSVCPLPRAKSSPHCLIVQVVLTPLFLGLSLSGSTTLCLTLNRDLSLDFLYLFLLTRDLGLGDLLLF